MIIPSIVETDFEKIKRQIQLVKPYTSLIQIDIADGIQVEGLTYLNIADFNSLELAANLSLELHFMVKNPLDYFSKVKGVTKASSHIEAENADEFIKRSKDFGYITGVSVNPETTIERVEPYLEKVDFVQFMTVVPGAQGRVFLEHVLPKIVEFKKKYPTMKVQVDGGVHEGTLEKVLIAGVNDIVVGSAIFDSKDPIQALMKLQKQAEDYKL